MDMKNSSPQRIRALGMQSQAPMMAGSNQIRRDTEKKKKAKFLRVLPWVIAILLMLGGFGTAAYVYKKYRIVKDNPQALALQEADFLVGKVSRLMQLPPGEAPTVATVLDREKLKNQAFFNDAQNNDKLLIYTKAQKAILYRTKENKIVNVGPIVLDNANKTDGAATEPTLQKDKKNN